MLATATYGLSREGALSHATADLADADTSLVIADTLVKR